MAGLLLPRRDRGEWLAEWKAELRHVLGSPAGDGACVAFSLGALPDAFWIRWHTPLTAPCVDSPGRCLTILASAAAVAALLALLLPATRREIFPPAYRGPSDVMLVSPVPALEGSVMQVSGSQYLEWSAHAGAVLAKTAFYLPVTAQVEVGARREGWSLGRTTAGFAALLGIRVPGGLLASCRRNGERAVILSRREWVRAFAADPKVVGRVFDMSGHRAVVVGVAPQAASYLPAHPEAWTLETLESMRRLSMDRFAWGFMLAQPGPGARASARIMFTSRDGMQTRLFLLPLSALAENDLRTPQIDFLLALILTCLVLPAILSIVLRTRLRTERISFRMRARGWLFLLAKGVLVLPLLFCGPLLLGHFAAGGAGAEYAVQIFSTCGGALLAAVWIADDQRRRCPHCLRRLVCPARVGDPSRSLLSFSGMEFVCAEGHGLMHVPDFPTSWFAHQRWFPLDASWRELFQPGS
jgi:hypothetical protein